MYQWPPFTFFDHHMVTEEGSDKPHPLFKELNIVCCTSGRGNIIVGDIEGFINIVDRDFKARAFQAYDRTVKHVQQLKGHNILVTVGSDDHPIESTLRIWNLDKQDKTGNPLCVKSLELNVNKPITKLASTEDLTHIAVGTMDGTVILVCGDIVRERKPKHMEIRPMDGIPVTGLGWNEGWLGGHALYVVTSATTQCFHFFSSMRVEELDPDQGAELDCAVLSEQNNMIAARDNAIYFFAPDVRRDCLAFAGPKKMIAWFRSHLVVVWAQDTSGQNFNTVNIYDLRNKFTAFTKEFHNVTNVITEWGSIFILTADGKCFQLEEKDTQTKLDTLFKNDLYSVAINLAKSSQGYDANAIVDIYRKYGDYLYARPRFDFDGAMAQYLQTIGGLEPSYVIRKFLDAQRIHNLTTYLQALHTKKIANPDHTTLLLNCFTKLKDEEQINAFIEKSEYQFDVDTAISVCRQAAYYVQALRLAKRHRLHHMVLKILLEDLGRHSQALEYIRTLDFAEAEAAMKLHGKELTTHLPAQSTELVQQLCTSYQPSGGEHVEGIKAAQANQADDGIAPLESLLDDISFIVNANRASDTVANPADFVHIFVNQPEWLVMFLEFIIEQEEFAALHEQNEEAAKIVYDTLLEMYLREDDNVTFEDEATRNAKRREQHQKALALLLNDKAMFHENHALVLAKMHGFHDGVVLLYERQHMYNEKLHYFMELHNYDEILKTCKRHGDVDDDLWVQALSFFASQQQKCESEIKEVLKYIERNRLLPPLLVIQILAQNKGTTLSVVKDYIIETLKQTHHLIREDKRQIREISEETDKMRTEIEELKTSAKIFQVSKCSACLNQLDPHSTSVHFLCMHSFHQRCLGDSERECPICLPENKKILDIRRHLEENADQHDQFYKQLDCAVDGFSKVAEYFGRGIFQSIITPGGGNAPSK
eukprot:TRINITY_DN4366_c0_g1_i5.p1 TRINITY_DN4366_c0_g1~~TRINITY_DN4366_c0_g1_i5.p1  ORF type:complete len:934 (-),score=319.64 TRINITY_DN4366_c0_g1_i5:233-3034(-)